jgi:hypothetical protein
VPGGTSVHLPANSLDLEELDADGSSIAILNRETRILWVNKGWTRFARENGGELVIASDWGPGALYLAGMSAPLVNELAELFAQVLRSGEPFVQQYLCSSPALHREFRMRVLPVEGRQLLCEHTLVRVDSTDASTPAADLEETRYRGAHGLISMCAQCGRTKRLDGQWQWIPSWAAQSPPATSHGLCASCFSCYYGALAP